MTADAPGLRFEVALTPPDLEPWLCGNTGVPGFWRFRAARPGPHVALVALMHGNELPGAIVLARLLSAGIRSGRGTLTLGFANLAAFACFEAADPTASRFLDEDMNRLWDPSVLQGNRESRELARAREIWPLLAEADILLDLHSMLWPSEPLLLCGPTSRGRDLACALGVPPLVVADEGHASGRRLIDAPRFADADGTATAILLESGQHWQADSVELTERVVRALLHDTGVVEGPAPPRPQAPRFARVTQAITASTGDFSFVRPYRGGEIVRRADTLIAMDGPQEIRTPHDDCLLVMPSLRPSRGHTAVRLARTQ